MKPTILLMIADDTLVFCGASKVQLLHLNWILMWFEAMSGLRINLDKSELIPVGCVNNVEELAAAIGCKVGSLPTSYLGLPLGAQYRSRAVWDGVEERMRKKLARWKSQYISKGGRITLIRSTLANMPIYFMSMLSMPRKVRLRLERIQREFLWGGGAIERKIHLVKWELVCLEKENGGLGVKSLSILNKALLCKWSWRFAMEREAFWNQVIRGKYGEKQGDGVQRKQGGRRMVWDAWVRDVWRCNEGGGSWSPLFSRPFNDWELEEVCSFFVALNRKQIQQGVDDRVIWRETKCGMFSVKSLYKSLVSGHPISFPSSAIWKVTVQPKWVLPATVKETLSGWNGSFVGKKRKGVWKASPLCLFWTVWKTRNKVAFEEKELSIQRLKASFVYFLWSETKRSIKDGPSTLVDFVGWVASR
ncbi:putative ribonuclease H protein [Vitis vinifera]|uniref:Putative ribonuclease H protein n=1 Tax=Vitis vinifera TaxID=29760 RepID=A0A438IKK7_VITVI|nr:putative ribonuclease H protein [Vitis vinifera]